jgi:hypothetical protein
MICVGGMFCGKGCASSCTFACITMRDHVSMARVEYDMVKCCVNFDALEALQMLQRRGVQAVNAFCCMSSGHYCAGDGYSCAAATRSCIFRGSCRVQPALLCLLQPSVQL